MTILTFRVGKSKRLKKTRGFTLVEVLIDLVIVAAIALAIIAAFFAAAKALSYAKSKIAAVALANERMEIIRNMPYDDIGTTEGAYPPGIIPSEEEVERKNINFNVVTDIRYRDDPFDGTIDTDPVDLYPYDYKKIEIQIFKIGNATPLAVLTTNISGSAAETATGTGILYFCALDSADQPVSDAELTIMNNDLDPVLNLTYTTGADGCVMIPLLPPDQHNNYVLILAKDGYTLAQTYSRTPSNPDQYYPNIDILEQEVTRYSLRIDVASIINISVVDLAGAPVPSLNVHVQNDFEIQFNPVVYKYDEDHDMDVAGLLSLTDMEWGGYSFDINTEGYFLSSIVPIQPVDLQPGSTIDIVIYVTNSASAPKITNISPADGVYGISEHLFITGSDFDTSCTVKLVNPNTLEEYLGTGVSVHPHDEIDVDFDLSAVPVGVYDLYVTHPDSEYAKQVNGFEVLAD